MLASIFSLNVLQTALELGCIYALVALALFLSYSILNIADLSTDGCFTLGCAVACQVALTGHPILALFAAMAAGVCSGFVTAFLQTRLGVESIMAGIIVNTGLYTINLAVMGFSSTMSLVKTDTVFSLAKGSLSFLGGWYKLAIALARQGGQKDDRRVGEIAEVAADLCRLLSHGVRVLVHKIPLIHDDDAGLSGLVGQTGDLCVLLRHALDGVDEDQTDVCALNGGDGAEVGIFFNGVIDLGLAPHSGGIDEAAFAEFVFKIAVDGVARRSGDIGDNDALLPENAVEQAGFADVRPSADSDHSGFRFVHDR